MPDVWGWDWSVYEEQLQKMNTNAYYLQPHELDSLRQLKDFYSATPANTDKGTMIDHMQFLENMLAKITKILNVQRQHGIPSENLIFKQKKIQKIMKRVNAFLRS